MIHRVGADQVGDFARQQLEAARRDPRLDWGPDDETAIADFWVAVEEAERVRNLGLWGLQELTHALERKEDRLGVKHDADDLDEDAAATLQAAYERAEMAKAELANGSPHGNAQALVSLNSALDAMVENLAKSWRAFRVRHTAVEMMTNAIEEMRTHTNEAGMRFLASLDPETLAIIERDTRERVEKVTPKAHLPRGAGIDRYEKSLEQIGWAAPPDRPIPPDLDAALRELNSLRDVWVHRAGRVDQQALEKAPTLKYKAGQLVRITRLEYRRYAAAVRCYAEEITFRPIRSWAGASENDGPDLLQWTSYVPINT
jgi:hypothetical protein